MRFFLALSFFLLLLSCSNPPQPQQPQPEEEPAPLSAPAAIDATMYPLTDGHYLIDWQLLSMVEFEKRWNDSINDYIYYPVFHEQVKAFEGKPVEINGYVIPFEETQDAKMLVLSAFPFSSCFFCGAAGPESVMDIQLADGSGRNRYKQDTKMNFRGRLRLNDTDVYYLNYILEEAVPVSAK
jgi:hypothetical protein